MSVKFNKNANLHFNKDKRKNCLTQLKKQGEKKSELQWNINCVTYVQGTPFPHPLRGICIGQFYQQTYSLKGLTYTVQASSCPSHTALINQYL